MMGFISSSFSFLLHPRVHNTLYFNKVMVRVPKLNNLGTMSKFYGPLDILN